MDKKKLRMISDLWLTIMLVGGMMLGRPCPRAFVSAGGHGEPTFRAEEQGNPGRMGHAHEIATQPGGQWWVLIQTMTERPPKSILSMRPARNAPMTGSEVRYGADRRRA